MSYFYDGDCDNLKSAGSFIFDRSKNNASVTSTTLELLSLRNVISQSILQFVTLQSLTHTTFGVQTGNFVFINQQQSA